MFDDVLGAAGSVLGETNEKIEWGLGFIGKYANYLLLILFVWVLAKLLKVKISV